MNKVKAKLQEFVAFLEEQPWWVWLIIFIVLVISVVGSKREFMKNKPKD